MLVARFGLIRLIMAAFAAHALAYAPLLFAGLHSS
jgi:hypothetical protein